MTGPEAIAATERLLQQITPGPWRRATWHNYRCVEGKAFDGSWRIICHSVHAQTPAQAEGNTEFIVAAPELVATLRAALLQSQEALQKLQTEHPRTCGWWCAEGETGCTCNRGLDSDIIKAALLSPPVAPKER